MDYRYLIDAASIYINYQAVALDLIKMTELKFFSHARCISSLGCSFPTWSLLHDTGRIQLKRRHSFL